MTTSSPKFIEVVKETIEEYLSDLHVSLPGQVQSYNSALQKADIQPLVKRAHIDEDGNRVTEDIPVIAEVPVHFQQGGGFRATFPLKKGDTGIILFSSSSLDQWLVKGGKVDPQDDRRHHLSDAFFVPGVRAFSAPLLSASAAFACFGHDTGAEIQIDLTQIRLGRLAIEPTIKGLTFNIALTAYLTAAAAAWSSLTAIPVLAPAATQLAAAAAAATTLVGALITTLTTTVKVE